MNTTPSQPITKAVIAAAGFGSRFLPATKAIPKEMLPLVDKPVMQFIIEELVDAGITDIIIVTSESKKAIEDHFKPVKKGLRDNLESAGKQELLELVSSINGLAKFTFVRQNGPYGNASPLLNAEPLLKGEPFIYAFADDIVMATPSRFKQMVTAYESYGGTILNCFRRIDGDYTKNAFVGGRDITDRIVAINKIIEKPMTADKAPSNLASISSYIMEASIFPYLRKVLDDLQDNDEFAIQPAMQLMIEDSLNLFAVEIENATYYDTGNKLEYVKAVVEFALVHNEIGPEFRAYMAYRSRLVQSSYTKRPVITPKRRTEIFATNSR
jgi:UTP--glucose-1-phosphate uridylyltransferase